MEGRALKSGRGAVRKKEVSRWICLTPWVRLEGESRQVNEADMAVQSECQVDAGSAYGERVFQEVYARLIRACEYQRIPQQDAEDLAQDFLLWLFLHPERSALASGPPLSAAIRIYLLRYRRRTYRRRVREGEAVSDEFDARGSSAPGTNETTISVRSLERLLPAKEALVLRELRMGASWAEAVAALRIPPGSRDWLRKRMADHVRKAFKPVGKRGQS